MAAGNQQDYYEVLGVARDASADQIKSAYRKAAMQHHPDRNPENKTEAEHNFRQCSEAYSVLSDPQKRSVYDRFGHAGLGSRGFETGGFNETIFEEFQDILGGMFGFEDAFGGRRTARSRRARATWRGFALRHDAEFRRSRNRSEFQDSPHALRELRSVQRHRREIGHRNDDMLDVRRPRANAVPAGIFLDHANVPRLPGCGQSDSRCVHFVPRTRPRRAGDTCWKLACRPAWIPERVCA